MDDVRTYSTAPIEILIAEDSATQAAQLTRHLATRGYHVTATRNGREALDQALLHRPALVITDIVMPSMDGYTLCKALKSDPRTKDVPVILLTSLSGPQDVLKGLECGADNFIRKPYDHRYLLSRIEYILTNLELRRTGHMQVGVQLYFGGQTYFITAEKQQILDLLISTYEGAIQINQELASKQQELARERDLLHCLMDNIPDFIFFKDIDGRYTRINRALAMGLGLSSPDEAIGKTDFNYFPEEFALASEADEKLILETGDPLIGKVERVPRLGKFPVWISTTKMLIRDMAGSAIGTFGVSRDITLSKLAEEEIRNAKVALEARVVERTAELAATNRQLELELAERERAQKVERETQSRFHYLFANNPLPMWVYDVSTLRFLEVNEAATNHYGYSAEEFVAMAIADIEPKDKQTGPALESKHRLKNGKMIDVEISRHEIEWKGRSAMLVVAQDITEQKRLQREFNQAQKMEAIGTLAAGVAHDFNNLLTIVNGYSALVLEHLNANDPMYSDVQQIGKAGERAAVLTRQLLAFSRKEIIQPRLLDINSTVADMDKMLQRVIGEDIELVTTLDSSVRSVLADPGQMEQVVMNLAVNARDAMPKGGRLTIETKRVEFEGVIAARHPSFLAPGSYVMLAVTDTGVGMDTETQTRIFEPFFTTKGPGKGTGLGLSTVYGIVERTGGTILVYSEVGRGTTFKVYIPEARDNATAGPKDATTTVLPRGEETVLVVEDEDGVRAFECLLLERQGYKVLKANDGSQAIHVSESHPGKIDLLITDLIMPVTGGVDLARRLTADRPGLKVLFTSGYTDNAIAHHGILSDDAKFLAKPFEPRTLARKVREVLDNGAALSEWQPGAAL